MATIQRQSGKGHKILKGIGLGSIIIAEDYFFSFEVCQLNCQVLCTAFLGRFVTRPDVKKERLAEYLDWSLVNVENANGMNY